MTSLAITTSHEALRRRHSASTPKRLTALIEQWKRLVDEAADATPSSRAEKAIHRKTDAITAEVTKIARVIFARPVRTFDDLTARALIAAHFADGLVGYTAEDLSQGGAAYETSRAVLELAGLEHLA